jgi:GDPmannose 4,6-dehydratase
VRALIFGASGQDGYYLAQVCQANGIESIGISRTGADVQGDISDYAEVEALVQKYVPAYVFHLAATSVTRHSALFENHATIATGSLNVLDAVRKFSPEAKVFITGSGVQFLNIGRPITEHDEFAATSGYAVARIHSVYAARYFRTLGIKTYVGYLFHHESPLRKDHHVSQMIVRAAQRIAAGSDEILELGDISVQKEWVFAGDVAEAILTLVRQDHIAEATIGSGKAYSIQEWLDVCFHLIGRDWRDHVRLRSGFTPEYRRLVSDPTTINQWAGIQT